MTNNKKNFDILAKKKSEPINPENKDVKEKVSAPKKIQEKRKPFFSNLKFKDIIISYSSFSIKKQTFFAKKLSFLIKAGVPVLESMHVIRRQANSKSDVKVFDKIIGDISNGQSLATSLSKFKGVFGNFTINIIRSGESSGNLTENLSYLADELKKKEILKKKIMGALLYPIIITIATFGITGLLVLYIFPKILPIFASLKASLPWSTRAIIYLTNVLRDHGLMILLGLVVLVVIFLILLKKNKKVRFAYDGFILRLPLIGNIVKLYNVTNVTRTLGLLLKSGISVNEALYITSETTDSVRYKKAFLEISNGIMKGKNISLLLESYPYLFPPMINHMISIGEKSGNLSNTLIYLSEFHENEFDELTKNLSSSIEPILMVVMGIIVGFVAISVITPIYEITNSIKK